ncbi:helicase [Sporocytophaga myxococcoides]|uniref:Helicase n=1 Tax=Sporocytophaga myxococcoides TaxID=153721 RepID=A0A098LIN0_9BACT|nr:DEAD/DEAH box helicase [Sporocytophaga myxococcoides]GAL86309.1 helicase [Sporocytophaga myxococcoides]
MSDKSLSIEAAIKKLNIELNEMQSSTIEATKNHNNILLLSPTGSGKTLAFLLPLLGNLKSDIKRTQAMIIVPARELALQIEQVFKSLGSGFKVVCCYGGHPVKVERNSLIEAPSLIIGTPGRLADHLRRKNISVEALTTLVLDEFDKSLEFGFEEDMRFIASELTSLKKIWLTSATEAKDDLNIFKYKIDFHKIDYLRNKVSSKLQLRYLRSEGTDKLLTLFQLLCSIGNESTLIFCNHRDSVERIGDLLYEEGIDHSIFHGGLKQEEREKALVTLRNGSCKILLTTDLASRGLDIPEIRNVIHYQLATTEEVFVHRNGRTARMFADGNVFLLLSATDRFPDYLIDEPCLYELPSGLILPEKSDWTTLYIGAGKKDKISKGDIVGLLIQKGELTKTEIGIIEIYDFVSFAAVKRDKAKTAIKLLKSEKLKKKSVKIDLCR